MITRMLRHTSIVAALLALLALGWGVGCPEEDQQDDDTTGGDDDDTADDELTEADLVLDLLLEEQLDISDEDGAWALHLFEEPFEASDEIQPFDGESSYEPAGTYWFALFDPDPYAQWEHPVQFVFVDEATEAVTLEDQSWWPVINDEALLMESERSSITVLNAMPFSVDPEAEEEEARGGERADPEADYGDAPDGSAAYYHPLTQGRFPTEWASVNAFGSNTGGHCLDPEKLWLGGHKSKEKGALDANDPDGQPNLVDKDGVEEMRFRIYHDIPAKKLKVRMYVFVNRAAGEADGDRYWNVLLDTDHDGIWKKNDRGPEWVVANQAITFEGATMSGWIHSGKIELPADENDLISWETWIRTSLTSTQVDGAPYGDSGWDGSGEFAVGEIEDHYMVWNRIRFPAGVPDDYPRVAPQDDTDPTDGISAVDCSAKCETDDHTLDKECRALVITFGDHSGRVDIEQTGRKNAAFLEKRFGAVTLEVDPTKQEALDAIEEILGKSRCTGDETHIHLVGHGGADSYYWVRSGPADPRHADHRISVAEIKAKVDAVEHCPSPADYYQKQCEGPGYCNLNFLFQGCHSGNFLRGKHSFAEDGINVLTAASHDKSSYGTQKGDDSEVSRAYRDAFRNNNADSLVGDGDGTVSAAEAIEYAILTFKPPDSSPQHHLGADCDCRCKCALEWFADLVSDVLVYPDKKRLTYVPHLDIEQWNVCQVGNRDRADELEVTIDYAGDLPGAQDLGFEEFYAVFDADPAADNYSCGCPTHDGDTAYIAQFLDGAWTMYYFTFSPIYGWQNHATTATAEIDGDLLTISIDASEAGIDAGELVTMHPATWTQQDQESVGDTTDLQTWMFPY